MSLEILKEMFREMVLKKRPDAIPTYYHPDFLLYTNGSEMNYETFLKSHQDYYSTPIQYAVDYDDAAFLEASDKLAGRLWITIQRPNEPPTTIEVMLIAQFKENKIFRLWELTYPDWSHLPAFRDQKV